MKYMRIAAFCLSLLMVLSLLTACGGSAKEYGFTVNSVTLTPGTSVGDKITQLGTYLSYASSGSCGGIPGNDEVYKFAGYTVYTTPGENGQLIAKVELTDDTYTTPEGIRIGSSKSDVISALGSGTANGDNLVYTGNTSKLTVLIRSDAVVGILYTEK